MEQKTARQRMNQSIIGQKRKVLTGKAKIDAALTKLNGARLALEDAAKDLQDGQIIDLDLPNIILQVQTLEEVLTQSKQHAFNVLQGMKTL